MDIEQLSSQAANVYDDNRFIRVDHSRLPDRGYNFEPVRLPDRSCRIEALPPEPLLLFQQFLPVWLVESWVCYTNSWASDRLEMLTNSCSDGQQPQSRLLDWKPTSVAEIFVWIATLIYMRIHKEPRIGDYWRTSQLGKKQPSHPIGKWMSLRRFQLLSRVLRLFDHTTIFVTTGDSFYSQTFSRVDDWSNHIQHISTTFFKSGTAIAIDECMVRFLGRSLETTTVPSKPISTGFKVWAVAQRGYFFGGSGTGRAGSSGLQVSDTPTGDCPHNYVANGSNGGFESHRVLYRVFLDKLFSSSSLFRRLRQLGHGATGTARRNCGLYRLLVKLKAGDNTAAGSIPFNCLKAIPTADNLVNQIAWKDNALVLFLSTVFTGIERVDRIRKRPTTDQPAARPMQEFSGEEPVKVISIPSIAATYNDEMNAVDRGDQMRAYWDLYRHVRRGGWRALAWDFLLEIALINSFILQQRGNPRWKPEKSQAEWRQRLVNDLVANHRRLNPCHVTLMNHGMCFTDHCHNFVPTALYASKWAAGPLSAS
ncbi:hypothetical protein FOPG_17984 [Fusarium oxysporum f. sp. conglutinans race 2 54008]|uniref:PiggyBac transposable element-derived protein domain-containing protein n=1 Tax=Fusarium oxysporum f. sp. conglutinans race 2 54008 TaxID=1089457 RepID=X0H135_FUSOX|nr:hypothetical protein FOPG_17984 [Fusarium oxysporum f. sp. conglutinans race 2 54008]